MDAVITDPPYGVYLNPKALALNGLTGFPIAGSVASRFRNAALMPYLGLEYVLIVPEKWNEPQMCRICGFFFDKTASPNNDGNKIFNLMRRIMPPATKQVRLPFDKLTESGLKPIVKKFEKWGLKVASIDSTNRQKRESGMLLKDAVFIFEDGQKMLVRVKSDGTVFQVKLNNKVVPIKNVDDMDKAVIEMVDYVQDNAKAYERAKIQREKRKKLNIQPPRVVTTRQEKIAAAKQSLSELSSANSELEKQNDELSISIAGKQAQWDSLYKELEQETAITKELEREIANLEKATA